MPLILVFGGAYVLYLFFKELKDGKCIVTRGGDSSTSYSSRDSLFDPTEGWVPTHSGEAWPPCDSIEGGCDHDSW